MNNKKTKELRRKLRRSRVFIITFIIILSLGFIGIFCIYCEHFISINSIKGESINLFGQLYDRTYIIDTLLGFGIVSFFLSLTLMLLFIMFSYYKRW